MNAKFTELVEQLNGLDFKCMYGRLAVPRQLHPYALLLL